MAYSPENIFNELFQSSLSSSNRVTKGNNNSSFDNIQRLYNYLIVENESIIKNNFFAKILMDLIEYYETTKEYQLNVNQYRGLLAEAKILYERKIQEIESIVFFNEVISLNFIKTNKIDKIYLKIITYILEKKKFGNQEGYRIIKKIGNEWQLININDDMLEELKKFLWETSLNKLYKISKYQDLSNNEKIHFNHFLFQISKETLIKGNLINEINKNRNILNNNNPNEEDARYELIKMLADVNINEVNENQTTDFRSVRRVFFPSEHDSFYFSNIIKKEKKNYNEDIYYINNENESKQLYRNCSMDDLKLENKNLPKCFRRVIKCFDDLKVLLNNFDYDFNLKIDLVFHFNSKNGFSDISCEYIFENDLLLEKNILNDDMDNSFNIKYNAFLIKIREYISKFNSQNNFSLSFEKKDENDNIYYEKFYSETFSESSIIRINNSIKYFYPLNQDFYNTILYILNESKFIIEIVKGIHKDSFKFYYANISYKKPKNTEGKICHGKFLELMNTAVKNEIFKSFTDLANSLNKLENDLNIRLKEFRDFKVTITLEIIDGIFSPYFIYNFSRELQNDSMPYKIYVNSDYLINDIIIFLLNNQISQIEDPASLVRKEKNETDLYED